MRHRTEGEPVGLSGDMLGRASHEGATVAVTKDGRAVVYSGEDSRFEYIFSHGQGPLTAANGFADQGEVLIKARQASDCLLYTSDAADE